MIPGNSPYREAAEELLDEEQVHVRKWRDNTTGVAFVKEAVIETPAPKGLASFAVLAHEVGHVKLHGKTGTPRWVEEAEAWEFAKATCKRYGFRWSRRQATKADRHVAYSWSKALRRSNNPERLIAEMKRRFPTLAKRVLPLTRTD